jgi:hypothetical protein
LRKKLCIEILTGIAQSYPHVWIGYNKVTKDMYKETYGKKK